MWWWFLVGFGAYAIVKTVLLIGWRQKIVWWELLPGLLVTVACAAISGAIEFNVRTADSQFQAGWITTASYYEAWNESHMVPVYDSEGNLTGYEQEIIYHHEDWEAKNNWGRSFGISRTQYQKLVAKWNNQSFVDMHRAYHSNDGDRYDTTYPGGDELLVPHTWTQGYTNRTQAAPSLFNYQKVEEGTPVFDYPRTGVMQCPSILGKAEANEHRAFTLLNCHLSKGKDVHVWVLQWENQPLSIALAQESHWSGGNRNEIVICIGLDKQREVQWSYVFGWTKSEGLKATIKNQIMEYQKLDLVDLAEWLHPEIKQRFVARDMTEFDYITIEPSNMALLLSFIFALLAQGGLGVWLVVNQHREGSLQVRSWRRRRY